MRLSPAPVRPRAHPAVGWRERRKYGIILAMLPYRRYRHAFEAACSAGVLTELMTQRCDRVTPLRRSLDQPWPPGPFDLVVLSEVGRYLPPETLRAVLDRQTPRLVRGATVVAAHWRRPVGRHPMTGDHANDVIAATAGLHLVGSYRDADLVIEVFDTSAASPPRGPNPARTGRGRPSYPVCPAP